MKKFLAGLGAVIILLGFGSAPADAQRAATTITLYSWSSPGWASGWHTHTETPAYDAIHVTWTYRGTTGCNQGADHFLVRILGTDDQGTVVMVQDGIYGSMYNSSYTSTFVVSESNNNHYNNNQGYRVSLYVGPQAACSASVRVWEYA